MTLAFFGKITCLMKPESLVGRHKLAYWLPSVLEYRSMFHVGDAISDESEQLPFLVTLNIGPGNWDCVLGSLFGFEEKL